MKKIAVLALGRIGKIHLQNLVQYRPLIEPVAITSSEGGRQFAQQLGVTTIYPNLDTAINDTTIDAYLVCSPSDTHFAYTKLLLEANKAIFCEKPLDLDIGRIETLSAMAQKQRIPLMVAFNRRFDPNFARLQQGIANGEVGAPHLVRITSRDPAPPPLEFVKHSGGLFLDMVIHDFDMCRFLLNEEVVEVFTKGTIRITPEIAQYGDVDTAVTILTFESGTIAVIDNSRKAVYGYDQRVEVFGEKGMLQVQNAFPDTVHRYTKQGHQTAASYDFFIDRYAASYKGALQAFLAVLLKGEPVPVTATDARAATQIGLAAMESVKSSMPVQLR